jgi:hypothetical protein
MARRRGFRVSLPGIGKLNNNQTMLLGAGVAGLGLLAFLAYTGKNTGIGYLDSAVDQFGNLVDDYGFPVGGGAALLGPMGAKPAIAMPKGPPVSTAGGPAMSMEDMVFSGAYATDAAMPYTDWWNNAIDEDDRIVIA